MLGDDYCVSDKYKLLKQNTQRFEKDSAILSGLRVLAWNDIYLFGNNIFRSVTRYFGAQVHQSITSGLGFELYRPERCNKELH
ncbi:uncharacterized protein BX663DRAFT_26148 [Cokeromyces recurvatus]|uniref:uncharacterized protein n=1 Tax=Cokeromyces recurvatus TaxID=90255 RepID=UPI00221E51AD|nr:uncharacterized protein BX663DRAFT_26148 [Cokeromyces recurvatus]KAI7908263.1 hypothetical protein BX663DRAFT_26148 [Cokeromyces recurvatus]